jgi:hypothetical protein
MTREEIYLDQEKPNTEKMGFVQWANHCISRHNDAIRGFAIKARLNEGTIRRILKGGVPELTTLEKIAAAAGSEVPENLRKLAYKRRDWRGLPQRYPREFEAFCNMHKRVCNPKHPAYPRYGGAGVTIHPDWAYSPDGFESFLKSMGPRPSPAHSIHCKPRTRKYGPGTAEWADKQLQALDQRGKFFFDVNGKLIGPKKAGRHLDEDGFFQTLHRNGDGTLKKRRNRKRKKNPRKDEEPPDEDLAVAS